MIKDVIDDAESRMGKALDALGRDLGTIRTGRASPALVERLVVDYYGSTTPLNQLAGISVPEPRLLNVQVWARSTVAAVERAIREANLGLNPITEGQVMRIPIPELNAERRKELVKVAHKYAEAARVSVRHVRRDGLDLLKRLERDGDMSEDEHTRLAAEVQKATDAAIADVEQALQAKEKDILTV